MTIKDAAGKEVFIGDKVAFGQAGRGAQKFEVGVITKLTATGAKIEGFGSVATQFNCRFKTEFFRIAGAFVIKGE